MRTLPFLHPDYPESLRAMGADAPPEIWVEGDLTPGPVHVAIVGAREATPAGVLYARDLAGALATRGAVVLSGGARGVDTAAHEGALAAGGRTWAVVPSGRTEKSNPLFKRIVEANGTVVSLQPPGVAPRGKFLSRNGLLVGLAKVVVLVQAQISSGTMNSALWATRLNRTLWAVTGAPWEDASKYAGSFETITQGRAQPLWSTERFLATLDLDGGPASKAEPAARENENENKVLRCLGARPLHVDEIVLETGLSVGAVMTALLTLALEDVVVEARERWGRRGVGP